MVFQNTFAGDLHEFGHINFFRILCNSHVIMTLLELERS